MTRGRSSACPTRTRTAAARTDARPCSISPCDKNVFSALGRARCRGRVARLEETSAKARAELDIALKFVDWFSQRGEGYEHNMTALDRRLDGMVRSAREASAEPFSPSVRLAA